MHASCDYKSQIMWSTNMARCWHWLWACLSALLFATFVGCLPIFRHGRLEGGMLRNPPVPLNEQILPHDQWIDQKLDHFNEANTKTWKQVELELSKFFSQSNLLASLRLRPQPQGSQAQLGLGAREVGCDFRWRLCRYRYRWKSVADPRPGPSQALALAQGEFTL